MEDSYSFVLGNIRFNSRVVDIDKILYHFFPGTKALVFSLSEDFRKEKARYAQKYDSIVFPYIRDIEKEIPGFLDNFDDKPKILILKEMPSDYFMQRFERIVDAILLVLPLRNNNFKKLRFLRKFHIEICVNNEIMPTDEEFLKKFYTDIRENIGDVPIRTIHNIDFSYVYNPISEDQNTRCPKCKRLLIGRTDYGILVKKIKNNKCICGKVIYGRF